MPYTKIGIPRARLEIEDELRERYGGMMTKAEVARELGIDRTTVYQWIGDVPGVKVLNRVKYRVRDVAKKIYDNMSTGTIVWMYTKKVDKYGKIVDKQGTGRRSTHVHERQSPEVHRRIQKNHRIVASIREDLFTNPTGIRGVLVGSLQLGAKILPGTR